MINKLPKEYSWSVSLLNQSEWDKVVLSFEDATLYQTYSYGDVRWGQSSLQHLILRKGGEIIGGCQVRIKKIPLLSRAIVYVPWGPLWRRRGFDENTDIFRYTLRALRLEFDQKRKMYVRVVPNEIAEDNPELPSILEQEGYRLQSHISPYRSIIMDLRPTLEDVRMKTLHKKWREKLNRAKRNSLDIQIGTSDEYFEIFETIFQQMYSRKQFVRFVDVDEFREINRRLPASLKLKIGLCYHDKDPVASLIWSDIGLKGISILSGTAHNGLKLRGSYLLRWIMFEQLKEAGCLDSDQGGLDPLNNPGGYEFRRGLGGRDITLLGQYDICTESMLATGFRFMDMVRVGIRLNKQTINRSFKKGSSRLKKLLR